MQSIKSLLVKIGRIQTVIIMAVVYFAVIGPMAILFQIFHRPKNYKISYWVKRKKINDANLYLTKQY
jgi:hypothetical protein